MTTPKYRMFIDDTGSIVDAATNHPQQRFGSVTGIIFDLAYMDAKFNAGFAYIKEKNFGLLPHGKPPVLHLRKIKAAEGVFSVLTDAIKREQWHQDCLYMYQKAQYHVITVCVDKIAFYHSHPNWTGSIYELLVGNAIERYFYFLRHRGTGDVMAEAVNGPHDDVLKAMYKRFYNSGTDHISAQRLQHVLTSSEIKIKPKNADIYGLQVADLLASTCFSHCKRIYANGTAFDPFAMQVADIIEKQKFYRDKAGDPHRYGRCWRP